MSIVLYEKKDRIAYITINRPEAMNAYNLAVNQALEESILDFDNDPKLWIAIITGAGEKAFCAGADLKEIDQKNDRLTLYRNPKTNKRIHTLQSGSLTVSKPMIAAVNGYALAGGMDIAVACDIRVASENAQFGLPMIKWGLIEGPISALLIRQIPMGMAMELAYTGDFINAQEAYRIGLVNRVVPLKELIPTAERLARRICENPPLSVQSTRQVFLRNLNMPLVESLRMGWDMYYQNAHTEDSAEGAKAFAEKRKPVYRGK